jgi:hypothetical protein
MRAVNIFLSGSIKKGRSDQRDERYFWTAEDEETIRRTVAKPVVLLNPAKSPIRRNDFFVNYGCDLYLVEKSHVVLVDLRTQKGLGVGAELMYAQFTGHPVVGWLPDNSYYKRERIADVFGEDLFGWTHPFVYGLCDIIADNLTEACRAINRMCDTGAFDKNLKKSPKEAIKKFRETYGDIVGDGERSAS